MKSLFTLLMLIFAFQISFGQEIPEGEYWEDYYYGKTPIGEYKNFTKEDMISGLFYISSAGLLE